MKRTRVDTEKIVSDALKEEVAEKDKKKKEGKRVRFSDVTETKEVVVGGASGDAGPSCEGPVREELSEIATTQRALARKGMGKEDDVEWVSDVRRIEEDLDADVGEAAGDVTLEPFNLKEEREEGDFQEDGFYVRRQDAHLNDAWLNSAEAKVCSSAAQKQHEEMQKRLKASDGLEAMTISEVTRCKKTIADLLLRRETVIQGLRRLGGKKSTGGKKKAQEEEAASTADPAAFAALTEAADALMSNGDVDVYTCFKEEFDHAVSMFTPASAKTEGSDGDDMFGDSDEEEKSSGKTNEETNKQMPTVMTPGSARGVNDGKDVGLNNRSGLPPSEILPTVDVDVLPASSVEQQQDDFDGWPISELKRFLEERGENADGIVEKRDLVKKATEVASKGPEGEVAAAPAGFVFDPSSGYFHSVESGMYFDSGSGSFYVSSTGKWYSKDWQELGVGV